MPRRHAPIIVDSIEGLTGLANSWNDLLAKSRSNTLFLTWEWLYSWAQSYLESDLKSERRLLVVLIYEGSKLIGVAPWCIRFVRSCGVLMKRIEFLGVPEGASDYLDVIAKRGEEKCVADRLYEFLVESTDLWDSIELRGITPESLFLAHLMNRIDKDGKSLQWHPGPYCPSVSLPQSVEAFRSQLSSNRRQQYARHLRLLQHNGDVQYCTYRRADVQKYLEQFWLLYEKRWGASNHLFRFVKLLCERCAGDVSPEVDFLTVDGRCVAGLLHFRYGNTMSMYLMGVDHSFDKGISIGNILVGLAIERTIREGCSVYDFLRGDEQYKSHWSNQSRRTMDIVWYGKKLVPMLQMIKGFTRSFAKLLMG